MDPDGDYESRHSIRSLASNDVDVDVDVASPSKIFAPEDDAKQPATKLMTGDAYDGPTAPPMEVAPSLLPTAAAAAASSYRSAMEPCGRAYDDLMIGKMDLAAPDEAPISNSIAVPIGFDSNDMVLPQAKALPIISSTANEGTKMPPATLDDVDAEGAEAQVDEEEPTPIPVPSEEQSSTTLDATSNESGTDQEIKVEPTSGKYTRRRKWCCCIFAALAVLGTVLGVLFGTTRGLFILAGYPRCNAWIPSDIGDGYCDRDAFNAECDWDGGDCYVPGYPDCVGNADQIGNGRCQERYNTAVCDWDGGDCEEFNLKYPNCEYSFPYHVGDGRCQGEANTAACGWDGGDCEEWQPSYPNCHVYYPNWINDGFCDNHDNYNTAKCEWDGGDCLFVKKYDKACHGAIGSTWREKTRAWCQYKCMYDTDCEAYDFNSGEKHCRLFSRYSSTTSNSNRNCWKKK